MTTTPKFFEVQDQLDGGQRLINVSTVGLITNDLHSSRTIIELLMKNTKGQNIRIFAQDSYADVLRAMRSATEPSATMDDIMSHGHDPESAPEDGRS